MEDCCDLRQCLKDIGCGEETAEQFLKCAQNNRVLEQIRILKKHRCVLMNCVHENQKRVDCVDYIIQQLENSKEGKK